jgi:hypothetical protein
MNNVEIQSAASDDGDGSSSSDSPSLSDGPSRSSGQLAAATVLLVHNNNPPGLGRKA